MLPIQLSHFFLHLQVALVELTQVPPELQDGLAGKKRKDRDASVETLEVSDVETEEDEPMEEGEENGSQLTVTAGDRTNTTVPAGRRLTAASRYTNQVCY